MDAEDPDEVEEVVVVVAVVLRDGGNQELPAELLDAVYQLAWKWQWQWNRIARVEEVPDLPHLCIVRGEVKHGPKEALAQGRVEPPGPKAEAKEALPLPLVTVPGPGLLELVEGPREKLVRVVALESAADLVRGLLEHLDPVIEGASNELADLLQTRLVLRRTDQDSPLERPNCIAASC